MEDVDMSQAVLRWVAFYGVDLSRVRLPNDDQHLIVHNLPCVMERAVAELAADPAMSRKGGLFEAARIEAREYGQQTGVFNRQDLGVSFDDDGSFGWALLERLEAECAAESSQTRGSVES
jgi:phosphoglycerate dehydrogenase-like enzyme